jgi:hypothetical protein
MLERRTDSEQGPLVSFSGDREELSGNITGNFLT